MGEEMITANDLVLLVDSYHKVHIAPADHFDKISQYIMSKKYDSSNFSELADVLKLFRGLAFGNVI